MALGYDVLQDEEVMLLLVYASMWLSDHIASELQRDALCSLLPYNKLFYMVHLTDRAVGMALNTSFSVECFRIGSQETTRARVIKRLYTAVRRALRVCMERQP